MDDAPHADDVALAARCADLATREAAIGELEARFADVLRGVTSRFARDAAHADELRQKIRERLFVGEAPRIAEYAGRGPLASWLRVTALRVCINAVRAKDPARPGAASSDGLGALVDAGADVELQFLKAQYRAVFRRAFAAAIGGLAAADRAVLRLGLVHGLSIDQLGVGLGVHRATAARRLASARTRLVELTVAGLKAELALDDRELASLQREIDGQVDVSLSRLLADSIAERAP